MPTRRLAFVQEQAEHQERHGPDRQIDPEHEGPSHMLDEEGAEHRPDDRSDTKDAGDVTLYPGAFGRLIDVADDGDRDRLDRAGSRPLQCPEQHQRQHAPGEAAQGRGEQEQPRPSEEDAFAAVEIGEASINRNRHRLGQQIGGKGPAEQVKPAKLSDDRRHRGGDDRAFHRRHEGRHHDGRQHEPSRRFGFDRRGLRELVPGGGLIEQCAPRCTEAKRDMYREPGSPNKRA